MKNILKNILLIIVSLIVSFVLSIFFGAAFSYLSPAVGGGLFVVPSSAANQIIGLPIAFVFFIALLFTIFGGSKKKWWIGILLAPIAVFWIFADIITIYFPIAIGLVGWALGRGVELGIRKFHLDKPKD